MNNNYIPDRNDLVWLDFEPTKGKEIGKYRPALILSSKSYNKKTGLVICSPVSTSIRGGIFEVAVTNLDKPSVVASNLIQTLSWRERKVKLITQAQPHVIKEVLYRLVPLIGAEQLLLAK